MVYKFTNKAKKVIEIANDISIELGHNYIGTEHILYGLVKEGEGIAAKVLNNKGITDEKVRVKIEEFRHSIDYLYLYEHVYNKHAHIHIHI